MNLENFAEYLKYPSRLYQLPYEELKSLTMQYPYCANFHVLLLIKSKLEGHPDLEKNLARAATYSVDRKHLRRIMLEEELIPAESHITIGEDEILELKDLFTLDEEWEKLPAERMEDEETTAANRLTFGFPDDPEEEEPISFDMADGENSEEDEPGTTPAEAFSEEPDIFNTPENAPIIPEDVKDHSEIGIPDAAATAPAYQAPEAMILSLSSVVGITQNWPASSVQEAPKVPEKSIFQVPEAITDLCIAVSLTLEDWWEKRENTAVLEWEVPISRPKPEPAPKLKGNVAPTPKSKFQSYQKRYRRPAPKNVPTEPPPPPPVPVIMPPKAKKVAEESLREDLGVASETLAGLLVQQHQYERAIKMYEHLSLLIPEKNTYFAAKIDAIKNL